jgi:hypothetical protein
MPTQVRILHLPHSEEYDNGWRYAFLVGLVPAFYAIVVRIGLPESPLFLERRGRVAEAEQVVRDFEESAGVASEVSRDLPAAKVPAPTQLWSPAYRVRTGAIWAVWFCVNFSYYGAFIWLPTLLVDRGFDLVRSFEYVLIITLAQLPGYALAAVLIEKWGRRPTLATMLVGSALAAGAFGLAHNYHPLPWCSPTARGSGSPTSHGRRYLDALAGYSALNFGHRHPAPDRRGSRPARPVDADQPGLPPRPVRRRSPPRARGACAARTRCCR